MTRCLTRMLENDDMPKVLVLFDSADHGADRLAERAAEGVKSLRFSEVDVRFVSNDAADGQRWRRLESLDAVNQYDGVIIVGSDRETSAAIDSLLASLERSAEGEFVDQVFAAVPAAGSTANRLSRLGGIAVGTRAGSADETTEAGKIGERVAKVAEWVRHALSHEHGHGHTNHAHAHHHHSH